MPTKHIKDALLPVLGLPAKRTLVDILEELQMDVLTPQMFGAVTPGVDCLVQINAALAALQAKGGGTLVLPKIGGAGYSISDRILVTFSNVNIVLCDNLRLTKTTVNLAAGGVPSLSDGAIHFRGTSTAYLENVTLTAPYMVRVDCNGRNVTGYTHNAFANGDYSGISFMMCKNPRMENIYSYNALSFGINMGYCPGGVIKNCDASHTVNENGIQATANAEHIIAFSETNPDSWSNVRILNCRAWNCRNHGIGSYGAVGVFVENPKIWNCGNNDGTAQAGPAGGLNIEHDGTNTTRDYRFTAVGVEVTSSFGFGARTNCRGTRLLGGVIKNTKKPTHANYLALDSNPPVWGSAVFIQGHADDAIVELDINGSERQGIMLSPATGNGYPGMRFKGRITGCVERAIYGQGVSKVIIDPTSVIESNGDANTFPTVDLTNGATNTDGGVVYVRGIYRNNQGMVLQTNRIGTVDLDSISGGENNAGRATAYHSIDIQNPFTSLSARNIFLTGANLKQARVLRVTGTAQTALIDHASIVGYQMNQNEFKADYAANTQSSAVAYAKKTFDPGSVPAAAGGIPGSITTTLTVNSVRTSDVNNTSLCVVSAGFSLPLSGLLLTGEVTGLNTVTVTFWNFTASPIDLASGVLAVRVERMLGN